MKTKNFLRWVTLGGLISFLLNKAFSSEEGKKIKEDLKSLTKKISFDIIQQSKILGLTLDKKKYEEIVEQVVAKYLKGIKIAKKVKEDLITELKESWKEIKKM